MQVRNVLLALLLSLVFTFIATVVYIFHPLIIMFFINREGSDLGSASGALNFLLIIEPLLFVTFFAVLQWRSKKG